MWNLSPRASEVALAVGIEAPPGDRRDDHPGGRLRGVRKRAENRYSRHSEARPLKAKRANGDGLLRLRGGGKPLGRLKAEHPGQQR